MRTRFHRKSPAIDDVRVLSALLSSPSTVLVGSSLDGVVQRWSPGAQALYGWTADEVVGRPLSLLMPPDRFQDLARLDRLVAGEDLPLFETVRLTRDGTRVPVEIHLVLLVDEEGKPSGTVALHHDLRDAQRLQNALRERDDELRARFHESPVPQSRVDLQGRLLAVNPALEELLGLPAESLVGHDAVSLYSEEAQPAVREALVRLVSNEVTSMAQEHDVCRPDGTRRRTVTSVSIVEDVGGEPVLAAVVEDITPLREAEDRILTEAARYDALLASMPVAVFTYDLQGVCTSSRGQGLDVLGFGQNELVGTNILDMYVELPEVWHPMREALDGQESQAFARQAERDWRVHYRALRDPHGSIYGAIGVALDVTDLVTAESEVRASEARLQSLLRNAADVAFVIDAEGRIAYASPAVSAQLGYDGSEMIGRRATDYNPPEDRRVVATTWAQIRDVPGGSARLEIRVRHADGSLRWTEQVLTNLVHDPAIGGVVCNVRDVTSRRRAEEELRRLAVRDTLTGLANRTLLLDRIEQSLGAARRSGTVTGLVVLDVVSMSVHNELLGQAGGDELLRVLATRLEAAVRTGDSVARVGGDEFAVLVDDVASAEDLRALASSLLEIAADPVEVGGERVSVRLQAGSSLGPASDAGALLAAAEQAIPHDSWSRRVVVRSAEAEAGEVWNAAVERLRVAVGGELALHFQPVVRLDNQAPVGVEALVRWEHPERGLLAPSEFIPLAEQSGLVVELGAWVLRTAVERIAAWQLAGRTLSVAVNLSPRQLVGNAFPQLVRSLLDESGIPPELLILEVTESALMDDPGAPDVLRSLRDMGVRLALDDFGTGYSSLTYLKRFPVDSIKIDRSFVSGLGRDADDEAIVASVVSLARAVGKLVVAEGVETVTQLAALRDLGVDQAQGFLWARGLPAADIDSWLDGHRAESLPPPRTATAATPTAQPEGGDEQRIIGLHLEGASLHTIAAALNAEGRRTPAGPRWTTTTVARVIAARLPRR